MSFRDRRSFKQIGGLRAYFRQALWGFWWRATLDRRLRAEGLAKGEQGRACFCCKSGPDGSGRCTHRDYPGGCPPLTRCDREVGHRERCGVDGVAFPDLPQWPLKDYSE